MNTDYKKEIQDFMIRVESLTYKDHDRLEDFLEKLKTLIARIFGEGSSYIDQVIKIRFKPASFFSSEMDYLKSFLKGQQDLINFLKTILDDPLLKLQNQQGLDIKSTKVEMAQPIKRETQRPIEEGRSISPDTQKISEIRESLSHTMIGRAHV